MKAKKGRTFPLYIHLSHINEPFVFNKQHCSHRLFMLMMTDVLAFVDNQCSYTLSPSAHLGPSWKLSTLRATPNKLQGFPAKDTYLPPIFPCAIRAAYPLLPSLIPSIEFLSRQMAFRQLDVPISPVRMASPSCQMAYVLGWQRPLPWPIHPTFRV